MNLQLTRERKIILISGGVLLCLAVLYLVAPSIRNAYPPADALELKQIKLTKYRKMVREKIALESKLKALQRGVQITESKLLKGNTASLAAVEVQQMVSEMIKAAGGQIRTTRVLSVKGAERDRYTAIPIEISGQVSIPQLVQILHAIHTADKILRIPKIGIRAIGAAKAQQSVLTTMTVEGFMKDAEG